MQGRGGPAIELTEETGATYGAPEKPEETGRSETPARPASAPGAVPALGLIGVLLLAALVGVVPWWVVLAGSVLAGLGVVVFGLVRQKAGDAYGRLLDERLGTSGPIGDDVQAEIDAARANRWLQPADAPYFEQRAYVALLEAGAAAAWEEPAALDRLDGAERVLSLEPEFVQRAKLDAYRRAHVEATADHDLTEGGGSGSRPGAHRVRPLRERSCGRDVAVGAAAAASGDSGRRPAGGGGGNQAPIRRGLAKC